MTNSWTDIKNTDLVVIMGGNAAEAHPCGFKWVTEAKANRGAKLIVIDPRQIALVKTPHVQADYHLQLRPGTNVGVINSIAHVIVKEGLLAESYIKERCDMAAFERWKNFIAEDRNSPETMESSVFLIHGNCRKGRNVDLCKSIAPLGRRT